MRISTKGRYGARAMLSLAGRYNDSLMRASEIAEEQTISHKYLENLLATLKAAGLVISERGKKGGYALSRSPAEITLYDILSPLEDSLDFVHCTEDESSCERVDICVTRELWIELKAATDRILKGTTLADLHERLVTMKERIGSELPIPPARC